MRRGSCREQVVIVTVSRHRNHFNGLTRGPVSAVEECKAVLARTLDDRGAEGRHGVFCGADARKKGEVDLTKFG